MGSVINLGKRRDKPLWYVKYKDATGKVKWENTKQPTKEQAKIYLRQMEANIAVRRAGYDRPGEVPVVGPLMEKWRDNLRNRAAKDDRSRVNRFLLPEFRAMDLRLLERDTGVVMDWIGKQRAGKVALEEGNIRHNLNLLSRFFGWAIEHRHAGTNPVRMIPVGKRPQQKVKRDEPWLNDDGMVRTLMHELPEPFGLMFYVGNRCGLRTGEIAGLRMSDLE